MITILAVLSVGGENFIATSINRVISLLLGAIISSIVNIAIKTPNLKIFIIKKVEEIMNTAESINLKATNTESQQFENKVYEMDFQIFELLQLRRDYINEQNFKHFAKNGKVEKELIVKQTFESFIRLHNVLESIIEYEALVQDNHQITTDTRLAVAKIIKYHHQLAISIFSGNSKINKIEDIKELVIVRQQYLARYQIEKDGINENLKIIGIFTNYCDAVLKLNTLCEAQK